MILDLRDEQKPAGPDPRCGRIVGGRLVMRDPSTVDAIMLHQTGLVFSVNDAQIKAAGGDAALAKRRRALREHAHAFAWTDGSATIAYPLRAYVHHGNGGNARSIGLEVEGSYNGAPGGRYGEPTPRTIDGACAALAWLVEAARAEGMPIRYVLAHRQFSSTRQRDPGWRIWDAVALDYAERQLGLETLPALTDRDGRAIPRIWDRRQAHTRY